VFTVWPGRYGQAFVVGKDGSCVSEAPSNSYCNASVVSKRRFIAGMGNAYIVVVGLAHLEAPTPLRNTATVAVTNDILKGVTSPPLTAIPSNIPLHCIRSSEVVPRAYQVHCLDRRMRPTACPVSFVT